MRLNGGSFNYMRAMRKKNCGCFNGNLFDKRIISVKIFRSLAFLSVLIGILLWDVAGNLLNLS